jgi:poly-beta-1,6-N-acetyl-D-glucosamine synthase
MKAPNYAVITPVRNEKGNFPKTIASLVGQTTRPARWIIVDDGSTDGTGQIADNAAKEHSWIQVVHRADRGFRKPGGGVMESFHEGFALLKDLPWDFLGKLDADLVFEPDYFQRCLQHFERNPKLGVGGGMICRSQEKELVVESKGDPAFHVRGATKIYRRKCWDAIGGLIKAPGWDTVDEVKANMLGWQTYTFKDLPVRQLKDTGSADGAWPNWVKNGRANYITGYHPLFMLAKCVKRIFSHPFAIGAGGLAWGFISGYLRREPRVNDADLIRYIRREQIRKLTMRDSIWG